MSETDAGVAVINNSKYGVGIGDSNVTLSLLRATERPDPTSDIGHHEFTYMIIPHKGNANDAKINNIAFEYNIPLIKSDANIDIDFGELYLQALKLSEDGESIIVRLSEQNGKRGTIRNIGTFTICDMLEQGNDVTDAYSFKPFEIITLKYTFDEFRKFIK